MPATDGPSPEIGAEILALLQVCTRLAALQHRIAVDLHNLGVIDDTTHLAVIARGDQIDAHIDQARANLISDNTDPGTTPHDSRHHAGSHPRPAGSRTARRKRAVRLPRERE